MEKIKQGYRFDGDTLRNGAAIPPDGEWLIFDGPIVPCQSGLHMSEHPYDSLQHAPGSLLCRVELAGELQSHGDPIDKWVGRRRRIVQRADATKMLRLFARQCALDVAHLWDIPEVVREYLETGQETLREAASTAASDAASDAPRNAASAAARTAAWAAASATCSSPSWTVASGAARDAAWASASGTKWTDAAWDAAQDRQRARFLAMAAELLRQP